MDGYWVEFHRTIGAIYLCRWTPIQKGCDSGYDGDGGHQAHTDAEADNVGIEIRSSEGRVHPVMDAFFYGFRVGT